MSTPSRNEPPGQRELKVEDALLYLDQVKVEFQRKPEIYNEFLDIMKNFKAQTIDTPGVIKKVSDLFRGYRKLILGFNTFLPEGHKINNADIERSEAEYRLAEEKRMAELRQRGQPDMRSSGRPGSEGGRPMSGSIPPDMMAQQPGFSGVGPIPTLQGGIGGMNQAIPAPPQPQHQEFDHAISYVTNIKQRFSNEPDTYKAFLDILHEYQRDQSRPKEEQKGIQEVLDKVSKLFADHPDLLKEFTYFLPDAVQGQAKERLDRAARESMDRKAARLAAQQSGPNGRRGSGARRGNEATMYDDLDYNSKRSRHDPAGSDNNVLTSRKKKSRSGPLESIQATSIERAFFERVKIACNELGNEVWFEFVQSLNLYNSGVLEQADLLMLVGEILSKYDDLYDEFKVILSFHSTAQYANELWAQLPISELDLSQCRRCTPSYRALPSSYPKPVCSKRDEFERKVLNDNWVGVPLGSEENCNFKHMRKNHFEEELFKYEDLRFEIDMVIETNKATLLKLQPLVEEINELKSTNGNNSDMTGGSGGGGSSRYRFKLDERSLSTVHLASISRVYGDHAEDILLLLKKHPIGAIPIIYKRLEQKDIEWRKARQDKIKEWRPILASNFIKALDHRGEVFKLKDKKISSNDYLLNEILEMALLKQSTSSNMDEEEKEQKTNDKKEELKDNNIKLNNHLLRSLITDKSIPNDTNSQDISNKLVLFGSKNFDEENNAMVHCNTDIKLNLYDLNLQWDAYLLIRLALIKNSASYNDSTKACSFYREILIDFFNLPFEMLSHQGSPLTCNKINFDYTCIQDAIDDSLYFDPKSSSLSSSSPFNNQDENDDQEDDNDQNKKTILKEDHVGDDDENGHIHQLKDSIVICPNGYTKIESYNKEIKKYELIKMNESKDKVYWEASMIWIVNYNQSKQPPSLAEVDRIYSMKKHAHSCSTSIVDDSSIEGNENKGMLETGELINDSSGLSKNSDYPEPTTISASLGPSDGKMIILSTPGYNFIRLYIMLIERLKVAKLFCEESKLNKVEDHPLKQDIQLEQQDLDKVVANEIAQPSSSSPSNGSDMKVDQIGSSSSVAVESISETVALSPSPPLSPPNKKMDGFDGFLQVLYSYFRGDVDLNKYEDVCRSLVGPNAYLLTTIEKHVSNASKSLASFVHDKSYLPLMKLYKYELSSSSGLISPKRYILHAKHLFKNHQLELFRIQFKLNQEQLEQVASSSSNNDVAYGEIEIEYLGSTMSYPKQQLIPQVPNSAITIQSNEDLKEPLSDSNGEIQLNDRESEHDREELSNSNTMDVVEDTPPSTNGHEGQNQSSAMEVDEEER